MGEACQIANNHTQSAAATASTLLYRSNNWYALKVRSGGELTVVTALQHRGFSPYCPTQKERRRYSDRMKVVEKPVFPGYVFCAFDVERKLPVISCPGVDHIVGFGGAPTPIPEVQIESIRRMEGSGAVASERLMPGTRVRVTHGPLSGVEGILVREPRGSRLLVSVGLLGQAAALYVAEDQTIAL